MLIKILGVGIVTIIISSILKEYKSNFSTLVNVCGGLIIFVMLLDSLSSFFSEVFSLSESAGVSHDLIKIILKIIAAGYLTEFCSDIADDCGNKFLASKVLIGGKISICVMAFPIIKNLFQTIISLI